VADSTRPLPYLDETLFRYYRQELEYLIEGGKTFARLYPEEAGRLGLDRRGSTDPHVERLIEAVAFQTARVQERLDRDSRRLAASVLELLLPEALVPIPAFGIARFVLDPEQAMQAGGYTLPRGCRLIAQKGVEDVRCRFLTVQDITLWPLRVTGVAIDASMSDRSVLKLRVAHDAKKPIADLSLSNLTIHLPSTTKADPVPPALYEGLVRGALSDQTALIAREGTEPVECPGVRVRPTGFTGSRVLDTSHLSAISNLSHPAHALALEYLHFPQRFAFLDITGLEGIAQLSGDRSATEIELLLPFAGPLPSEPPRTGHVEIGCAPIVNLFEAKAAPRIVTSDRTEYAVRAAASHGGIVPEAGIPYTSEVFTVSDVRLAESTADRPMRFEPFLHFRDLARSSSPPGFWIAERHLTRSPEPGVAGGDRTIADVAISLVDLRGEQYDAAGTLHVSAVFSNRNLPSKLFAGDKLDLEAQHAVPIASVTLTNQPSEARHQTHAAESLWRIIAHLSLNSGTLLEEHGGRLRDLMSLYAPNDPATSARVRMLARAEMSPAMRYLWFDSTSGSPGPTLASGDEEIPSTADAAMVRGIAATFDLREPASSPGGVDGPFLLGLVLDEMFAHLVGINSFVQTAYRITRKDSRTDSKITFPPRIGTVPEL